MRTHQILSVVIASALIIVTSLLTSCSDLKTSLPVAESGDLKVHDFGWSDSTSSNFHGLVLKKAQYNFGSCVSCHSKQFTGGVSGVSCLKCHPSYPHLQGWENPAVAAAHGRYPENEGMAASGMCVLPWLIVHWRNKRSILFYMPLVIPPSREFRRYQRASALSVQELSIRTMSDLPRCYLRGRERHKRELHAIRLPRRCLEQSQVA